MSGQRAGSTEMPNSPGPRLWPRPLAAGSGRQAFALNQHQLTLFWAFLPELGLPKPRRGGL